MNNREIKFRVWDKLSKVMINNVVFDIQPITVFNEIKYANLIAEINNYKKILIRENYDPDDWIIQQFTGLKDSKGNEVYEGDIINIVLESMGCVSVSLNEKLDIEIGYVFYNQESCGFRVQLKNNQYTFLGGKNLEIIGNICENPELLKYE